LKWRAACKSTGRQAQQTSLEQLNSLLLSACASGRVETRESIQA
jgi:hypothetical protein